MARAVVVYGLSVVSIAKGVGGSYSELGTTQDGVMLSAEHFTHPIKNDENGGQEGPPVEIQTLGRIDRVRCELTKYDSAQAAILEALVAGASTVNGTPEAAGVLLFAGDKSYKVKIVSTAPGTVTTVTREYKRCVIHRAEHARGTKASTFVIEFEGHKDSNSTVFTDTTA